MLECLIFQNRGSRGYLCNSKYSYLAGRALLWGVGFSMKIQNKTNKACFLNLSLLIFVVVSTFFSPWVVVATHKHGRLVVTIEMISTQVTVNIWSA